MATKIWRAKYKDRMMELKNNFAVHLLEDFNQDYAKLQKECEDKENGIKRMKEYISVLEKI